MRLNTLKVGLTDHAHAHDQYIDRVQDITYSDLVEVLQTKLTSCDYIRDCNYLKIHDSWWVCAINDDRLSFITCYGKSHIDIPKALAWSKKHNDRIGLERILYAPSEYADIT